MIELTKLTFYLKNNVILVRPCFKSFASNKEFNEFMYRYKRYLGAYKKRIGICPKYTEKNE